MRYALILFFLSINSIYADVYPVKLGNTTVIIKKQQHGKGKAFIHLHQNEATALKAAKSVLKSQGGSLLTLIHSGRRNIVFYHRKKRYEFDPNRIYTDLGIKKTLMRHGNYTSGAHAEVKKLADKIKTLLPQGKIIAVHNNKHYSLKNYFPGHHLASDAQALHFNQRKYYRNFYLVTRKKDYFRLKKLHYNSILQTLNVKDDGSLSAYLANREYINVEAGYNQFSAQVNMLKHA